MGTGANIKQLLTERGMSIKELSFETEIPLNTLYSITKRDTYNVRISNLQKIAKCLNVSISALLEPGQTIREYNPEDDTWDVIEKKEDGTTVRTIQANVVHTTFKPTKSQLTILQHFNVLNPRGQKEALKRMDELTRLEEFSSLFSAKEPPTTE